MTSYVLQLIFNGLTEGSRLAMLALGFSLIYGVTKTLHVAHGAIVTAGIYIFWWILTSTTLGVPEAILIAGIVIVILAIAHEIALYRLLRQGAMGGFSIVVASLGTSIIIQNILGIVFGLDTKDLRSVSFGQAGGGWQVAGVSLPRTDLMSIGTLLVIYIILSAFLKFTVLGQRISAVQDNPYLARVIGINSSRIFVYTFIIGTIVSAPAGLYYGVIGGLNPTLGFDALLFALIIVFLGGIGNLTGTVVAALIVGVVESVSVAVIGTSWVTAAAYLFMFIILIFRPMGLFGR